MYRIFQIALLATLAGFSALLAQASPDVQGFDASFVKYGPMNGAFRSFDMTVDYDPWHFNAKGMVSAGPITEDLDIQPEIVGIGLFHFNGDYKDAKGVAQKAGVADIVFVVDDERAKVKDLVITLLPAANIPAGQAALKDALAKYQAYQAAQEPATRISAEESALTKALSDPWNRASKESEMKALQAKVEKARQDSLARIEQARQDSIAKVQAALAAKAKAKQDSIAAVQAKQQAKQDSIAQAQKATQKLAKAREKAKQDSIAQAKADADAAALAKAQAEDVKPKKKKKKVVEEEPAPEPEPAPVVVKKKKKKPVVEEEESAPEPAPVEESVPVKKKKKKKTVVEDSDELVQSSSGPGEDEGVSGSKDKRKKIGIGMAIAGGVFTLYGLYEQSQVSSKLKSIQALEVGGVDASEAAQYQALSSQKKGAETQRTLGVVIGVMCIAGAVVLLRF